jgi:hypothetical protein
MTKTRLSVSLSKLNMTVELPAPPPHTRSPSEDPPGPKFRALLIGIGYSSSPDSDDTWIGYRPSPLAASVIDAKEFKKVLIGAAS